MRHPVSTLGRSEGGSHRSAQHGGYPVSAGSPLGSMQVHRPTTAGEAVALMGTLPQARWIGGGTDLVPLAREGRLALGPLVAVRALALDDIRVESGWLLVGAGATMATVARSPLVQAEAPALVQALLASASAQVRNAATLGGNLLQRTRCPYFRGADPACNRRVDGSGCAVLTGDQRQAALFGAGASCVSAQASDLAVALLALDARVRVLGPGGERLVDLEALYPEVATPGREHLLGDGDLILGIELPTGTAARASAYMKVRDRAALQFALLSLAVAVESSRGALRSVRLVAGGIGSRPWRLRAAEDVLTGREDHPHAWRDAAAVAARGAQPLPGNAFKVELLQRCVAHAGTWRSGVPSPAVEPA
jgi:xanthine dehydrogenase YagS FAD-binding subunit